jgi:hypothetical protein
MRIERLKLLMNLGVLDRNADEIEIMLTDVIFRHDPVIQAHIMAKVRECQRTGKTTSVGLASFIAAMTTEDRSALRNRILDECDHSPTINKVKRDA